jgi:putative PIN family toxin of toxin-antitoxin system
VRVVLDTNVLVSAVTLPGGRGEEALFRVLEADHQLLLSKPLLDELLGVLARKFSRDPEELSRLAVFLAEIAKFVTPEMRLQLVADDADNRVLECALAGKADVIVTGDKALLTIRQLEKTRIVALRDFLSETQ